MNAKRILIALLVVLAALPVPVSAQNDLPPGCSDEEIAATLAEVADLLAQAQELAGVDVLDELIEIRQKLDALERCRGLDLLGVPDESLGETYIPAGTYRVNVRGGPLSGVLGTVVHGTCNNIEPGEYFVFDRPINLLQSQGCIVKWEPLGVRGVYVVAFERME